MDFSRFPFVHEGLLGSRDDAFESPYEVTETDVGMTYTHVMPVGSGPSGSGPMRHEYNLCLPSTIHLRIMEPGASILSRCYSLA